ncbi:MAG: hypothetical protein II779_00480 [Clostridia bacterium]|nr:hypothetical protein [Clostridia bacterium]
MKKLISLALCLCLMLPVFAGCSENGNTDEPAPAPTNTDAPSADAGDAAETEPKSFRANIPEGTDYGGETFTVLTYPNDGGIWGDVDWSAEEITGEGLNDAVYNRMKFVDDLLNVKVTPAYMTGSGDTSTLTNSVNSADGAYQIATLAMQNSFSMAQNGITHELNAFAKNGTLDLTAPWWDGNILGDLSIMGMNFALTGDIGTMYKKSIGVIMFNKVILADHQLDNPYEIMREGGWTIDRMVEMGTQVSEDLDGDGAMTQEDRFGLICFCDMIALAMIGCDVDFCSKNESDIPENTFMSERAVSVVEKLSTLMYNPDITYSWSRAGVGEQPAFAMYQSDKSLFYYGELHAVATMRDMDSDFGIMPMPKYDESQDGYHHCVNPNVCATIVIPKDNIQYEKTGYVTDALGAASKNILTPAYYEINLKGKVSRDEESTQSLDIIISSIKYDIGYLGGFGISSMLYSMADSYNTDLASQYQKITKVVNKSLDKMVSKFEALAD